MGLLRGIPIIMFTAKLIATSVIVSFAIIWPMNFLIDKFFHVSFSNYSFYISKLYSIMTVSMHSPAQ